MTFTDLQRTVHELAVTKGWWPEEHPRPIPECLMLIVSEVSEAMEEYRNGHAVSVRIEHGKPEGMPVELADAVIRIMDLCEYLHIDLEYWIRKKHEYNETRPFRHGNKVA